MKCGLPVQDINVVRGVAALPLIRSSIHGEDTVLAVKITRVALFGRFIKCTSALPSTAFIT